MATFLTESYIFIAHITRICPISTKFLKWQMKSTLHQIKNITNQTNKLLPDAPADQLQAVEIRNIHRSQSF